MDLYNIKKDTLEPIDQESFKLEKDIQSLVEKSIETLFDLEWDTFPHRWDFFIFKTGYIL